MWGPPPILGPNPLTVSGPECFHLPPEGEISLAVIVAGQDKLQELAEMAANIVINGDHFHRVRRRVAHGSQPRL